MFQVFVYSGLCLLTERGSKRQVSVGEENITDSLFRKEGKAAHLMNTVKVKFPLPSHLSLTHIYRVIFYVWIQIFAAAGAIQGFCFFLFRHRCRSVHARPCLHVSSSKCNHSAQLCKVHSLKCRLRVYPSLHLS